MSGWHDDSAASGFRTTRYGCLQDFRAIAMTVSDSALRNDIDFHAATYLVLSQPEGLVMRSERYLISFGVTSVWYLEVTCPSQWIEL